MLSRGERRSLVSRWRRKRQRTAPSPSALSAWLERFHDPASPKAVAGAAFIPAVTEALQGIWRVNRALLDFIQTHQRVTAVITSPPYPNRFSYARETRPHLFYFDFIESATAVGQLETDAIGGRGGKATSVLSAGVAPKNDVVERLLKPHLDDVLPSGVQGQKVLILDGHRVLVEDPQNRVLRLLSLGSLELFAHF